MTSGPVPLAEIARTFLKLGTTAFGGPAAHVAMMEDEVVRRRGWLTREAFLDYLGATNLIPGPNSTEMAIHIGHARGGWPGLVVAGVSFIVPATLIVGGIAWFYVMYGALPEVAGVLYGVKPVVMAVVAQAILGLGRSAVKTAWLAAIGVASMAALAAGAHELPVLAGAGVAGALRPMTPRRPLSAIIAAASAGALTARVAAAASTVAAIATPFGLWPLFLVFAKIGSVLYGSGYVLLAFLRADLVDRLGWLTEAQLLDAVAVGQITPGPVGLARFSKAHLTNAADGRERRP